jgi:hypothetical protein
MSKLFKLKEWLTLDEAASHISNVLGEPATVADLYRFALDDHLIISVDFVNQAHAKKGKRVKTEDIEFQTIDMSGLFKDQESIIYKSPKNHEIQISEDDWIALEKPVISIEGIWDLSMLGAEKLDIEHEYQQLTSGLEVNLVTLDGVFVQKGDVVCQLQTDFDDNEFQKGSSALQKLMENFIRNSKGSKGEIKKRRDDFRLEREEYLEGRKVNGKDGNHFPSGGLAAHDYVLVVRTREITRFIQSLEDPSSQDKPLTSKERNSLLVLIGALCKEVKVDPNKRGVTPSLVAMTEILGAPLTDDTVRKILSQIEDAVSVRNK